MGAQNLPPNDPPLPTNLKDSIESLSKREKKELLNLAKNLETNFNHLALEVASEKKSRTKLAEESNLFEISPNIKSYISWIDKKLNKDELSIQEYLQYINDVFIMVMQLFLRNKENGNCNKIILNHITQLSNALRKASRFDSVLKELLA